MGRSGRHTHTFQQELRKNQELRKIPRSKKSGNQKALFSNILEDAKRVETVHGPRWAPYTHLPTRVEKKSRVEKKRVENKAGIQKPCSRISWRMQKRDENLGWGHCGAPYPHFPTRVGKKQKTRILFLRFWARINSRGGNNAHGAAESIDWLPLLLLL